MKAILEFNLPDDDESFKMATTASNWYSAMSDLSNYLRSELKHNSDKYSESEYRIIESIRNKLFECMNDNGISF